MDKKTDITNVSISIRKLSSGYHLAVKFTSPEGFQQRATKVKYEAAIQTLDEAFKIFNSDITQLIKSAIS